MRQVPPSLHCNYKFLSNYSLLGNLYIADTVNQRVRKVTVSTGIITTIAGSGGTGSYSGDSGLATSAALDSPRGVSVDATGNIYTLHIYSAASKLFPSSRQRVHC